MKTLKILFSSLIFMFFNIGLVFSDITASAPTNLISSIATATSFTSLEQISPEAASEIQNTTSSIIDGDALLDEVQQGAEEFGANIVAASEKFVTIGGKKNEYDERDDLEPTLGTIVYDTGLITLERVAGHYDTDNLDPSGNSKTIFEGTQQARIKVYVDFNRQVLFGSVESRISLSDGSKMTNTYNGKSTTISENTLPVDKELVHTVSSSTGLTLALTDGGPSCADGGTCPSVSNDLEPFAYDKNTGEFLNSLLTENGEQAPYQLGGFPDDDLQDMVKSVSHGSGGDKNVIVQARFLTAGPDAATGTSVASFEAYNGVPCASNPCSSAEIAAFENGIERYSKTVTTTATKYTEELPQ
ncbi:hypothetical protein OAS94_01380 [Candidatus Pelagibacter sp.]|nr:hypothetical protein [Candidatus Pelagibacter sp.]